jgi:hypothetical protein
VASYARPLADALTEWQRVAPASELFSIDTGDHLFIWDLRPVARRALTVLSGTERLVHIGCDAVTDVRQLASDLAARGVRATGDEVTAALAPMIDDGLVLQDGGRVLALAVPLGDYKLSTRTARRASKVSAAFPELRVPLRLPNSKSMQS